jgi:hypothetical protein
MASSDYTHPSYLTRQSIGLGASTAGANGTSGGRAFLSDIRIRNIIAVVRTAGTSATSGNSANIMCVGTITTGFNLVPQVLTTSTGTNTVGTIALGSALAFTTGTSGDRNTVVQAGSVLFIKNGTDATGVADVTMEAYINPGASWTGNYN